MSPETAIAADGPTSLMLVRASGDTVRLRDPLIQGDSVVGWMPVGRSVVRSAVAVGEVRAVLLLEPDYLGSAIGGVGVGFFAFTAALAALFASYGAYD